MTHMLIANVIKATFTHKQHMTYKVYNTILNVTKATFTLTETTHIQRM